MTRQTLLEKWEPVLAAKNAPAITTDYRKKVTAQLLENQRKFLAEASNVAAGVENWDPVLIGMVRRSAPQLIAYDVCGVQPMKAPTQLIFALRSRYASGGDPQGGAEALFNEADTAYGGAAGGAHDTATNPFSANYTTGVGKATPAGEVDAWAAMGVTIERTDVTAKTRQLRADYSLELAQDMRAVHGEDAEAELINILSNEITAEQNREVVRTIYGIAKQGTQWKSSGKGTWDMTVTSGDGAGRWFGDSVKTLFYAIERDCNAIAVETRRGKGNFAITSADVASALAMANILQYSPALQVDADINPAGATFVGVANGIRIYVDPYITGNGYVVGYKGDQYDAGMFFCPYVPLQLVKAVDPVNFHPALGFKTRYGLVANPFTTLNAGANTYYRKVEVTNL